MTLIDILDYSESSQKIPSYLLNSSVQAKKIKPIKVVMAHYLDLVVALSLSMTIHAAFSFYFEGFLPSWNVKEIYQAQSSNFLYVLFPLVLMSYYFFSYLFNEGQSLGLHSNSLRVATETKSFRKNFENAFHSSLICLTGGLSYFWKPSLEVVPHDYLYQDLFIIKDQHINLKKLLRARRVVESSKKESLAA